MVELILKQQPLEVQESYKLKQLIKDALFLENIQSSKTKKELERYIKPIPTDIALYHDNFIRFGTNKATSFVIIDIDKVSREHFNDIELYSKFVKSKLHLTPNWITKTSKGYHIGFILEKPIWLNNYKQVLDLISIKQYLTNILEADIAGSHRLIGFWRNPLTHNSIINVEKTYCIEDLFKNLDDTPTISSNNNKTTSKINIDKINTIGFVEGNRNNFLFTTAVAMLYNGITTNDEIETMLIDINDNQLPLEEVKKIVKSVRRYNIVPNEKKQREDYIAGEYHQELWDNGIHNYIDKDTNKTEFSRQKIGQKISTAKIIKSTIEKLVKGYATIYKNKDDFSNKNISKNTGVSVSTIKRYRNKRKIEESIKFLAFIRYIKNMNNNKESVKADEPSSNKYKYAMQKLVNYAIRELEFEYKKTGKKFSFYVENDDTLGFFEVWKDVEVMAA